MIESPPRHMEYQADERMEPQSQQDLERVMRVPGRVAAWLAATWVLGWVNAIWPFLRFVSTSLNHAFFSLVQGIPWVLLYFIIQTKSLKWRRWVYSIPMFLLAAVCMPIGLIQAGCSLTTLGGDRITKRVSETITPRGMVVVFYKDTGAVGYWGYLIRQQCTILPGLLAVRDLYQTPDHGTSASVEILDNTRVRISAAYHPNTLPESTVMVERLWPLPCLWSRKG